MSSEFESSQSSECRWQIIVCRASVSGFWCSSSRRCHHSRQEAGSRKQEARSRIHNERNHLNFACENLPTLSVLAVSYYV